MSELVSDRVILAAPMSFTGSAQRLWRMTEGTFNPYVYWLLVIPVTVLLISLAWALVLCWYLIFGILLVPYRLLRRSQRKDKKTAIQHKEMLEAIERTKLA